MIAQHVMTWVLALTVGQTAPPEAAWLKRVPAEADAVVRVRSAQATRVDLEAMVKAMSESLGPQIGPILDQGLGTFTAMFGEQAGETPFLTIMRLSRPVDAGTQPFAVIVQSDNYAGVLQAVAGGRAVQPKDQGGYDQFDGPQGSPWFAAKGTGFVAFGPDEALVKGIAKTEGEGLDPVLTGELRASFFAGDVGAYVNAGRLAEAYKDRIADAREQFMAALEQGGAQVGNAQMMDSIKKIYGGMFDAAKVADSLVLSLDFDKAGLAIDTVATVKPDSEIAQSIGVSEPGTIDGIGNLPAGASYYVGMSLDAKLMMRLQSMGMGMINPGAAGDTPESKAARDVLAGLGGSENLGLSSFSDKGMLSLNVVRTSEPAKYLAATQDLMKSMKPADGQGGFAAMLKDVKVTPKAQIHKGYTFDAVEMSFDFEKMGGEGNPSVTSIKSMFGGDVARSWLGTNGKDIVTLNAPTWDAAQGLLDEYLAGGSTTIGNSASFQQVRKQLPEKATVLMLMSAQGLVKQMASQFATAFQNPDLKVPADLPKEPAFLGLGVVPVKNGVHARVYVASEVGGVVERGLIPLFQAMQGRVGQ